MERPMRQSIGLADRRLVWMVIPAALLLGGLVYYPIVRGTGIAFMRYMMLDLPRRGSTALTTLRRFFWIKHQFVYRFYSIPLYGWSFPLPLSFCWGSP
jgi:ABC-type sugar transport system permease subunit